jgi:chemotaxis response regulator CheB
LTGLGKDGMNGSHAIHSAGGSIFAQDPKDCVAPSMPTAVINSIETTHVGELEALASEVSKHIHKLSKSL